MNVCFSLLFVLTPQTKEFHRINFFISAFDNNPLNFYDTEFLLQGADRRLCFWTRQWIISVNISEERLVRHR